LVEEESGRIAYLAKDVSLCSVDGGGIAMSNDSRYFLSPVSHRLFLPILLSVYVRLPAI
jgi:hypothetical protein